MTCAKRVGASSNKLPEGVSQNTPAIGFCGMRPSARLDPSTAATISELRRIVDFRNRIIHGYDTVDDVVVWGVVEKHLPVLVDEVSRFI